ncbi:MAG: cell division protein FtsZ [Candidatus Bathyarchaeota archaeon]|nr:MAG: cell division protein FtsZ [Candidatus Bathyarchaeota archaeon]
MQIEAEIDPTMVAEKSIEEIAREAVPKISILGIGGGGSNIVSWMKRDVVSARTIALNSDAQHLSISKADDKILLGYKTTRGLGCGGFPEQGLEAAEESAIAIEKAVGDAGLVFITTTLGGGTGTGASPLVARIAKELGSLTLGVVTIPFEVEGTRLAKAKDGLQKLAAECDSVIVVDNNRLREVAGELPLRDAFGVANESIGVFIKELAETLARPGHMNMDFADLNAIMKGGGVCAIGFGEGAGDTKVEDAIEKALNTQLLDIGDIKKAKGALIHIEGGEDMTLEDVNRAGEMVLDRISPSARVIWGARVSPDLKNKLRATVVLAGVESPFLTKKPSESKKKQTPKLVAKKVGKKAKKTLKVSRSPPASATH